MFAGDSPAPAAALPSLSPTLLSKLLGSLLTPCCPSQRLSLLLIQIPQKASVMIPQEARVIGSVPTLTPLPCHRLPLWISSSLREM